MSDAAQHEPLLSALLDGELNDSDRVRAEKLLADSPKLKQQYDQWREQSNQMRGLTRHRLDDEFADRVLQEIQNTSSSADLEHAQLSRARWKTGLAAVITLAALVLLALFVVPPLTESDPSIADLTLPILDGVADEMDEELAESKDATEFGSILSKSPEGSAAAPNFRASKNDHSLAGSFTDDSEAVANEESPRAGFFKKGEDDFDVDQPHENKKGAAKQEALVKGKGEAGRFGGGMPADNGTFFRDNIQRRSGDEFRAAPEVVQGFDDHKEAESPKQKTALSRNAVDQVLWVDMQSRPQPMAELEAVFARNSIQVLGGKRQKEDNRQYANEPSRSRFSDSNLQQTPLDFAKSGKQAASNPLISNSLTSQSELGVEALYVVSTPAQMKQALIELSQQANISGFQVPSIDRMEILKSEQQAENQPTNPSQFENFGNRVSEEKRQSVKRPANFSGLRSKNSQAAAQQLKPFEFRNQQARADRRQFDPQKTKTAQPKAADPHTSPGSSLSSSIPHDEIADLDRWLEISSKDSKSKLIQYLLLIQTTPASPAAESSQENQPAQRPNAAASDAVQSKEGER